MSKYSTIKYAKFECLPPGTETDIVNFSFFPVFVNLTEPIKNFFSLIAFVEIFDI